MKKILTVLLAVLLMCLCSAFAEEEPFIPDVLGQTFPDFTVKDTRKNEFTLSEALKDHDAVLINIWASWCGSCIREFPLLNEACNQYGDRVAFIALDFEPEDTLLDIANIRIENHLVFPMGKTAGTGIDEFLTIYNVPCTIVVDRFGTICFMHSNLFEDMAEISRVLDTFVGDDYTESRVLTVIPAEASTRAFPVSSVCAVHVDGDEVRKIRICYDDGWTQYGFVVNGNIAHLRFDLGPDDEPAGMVYDLQTDSGAIRHALPTLFDPERNAFVYDQSMDQLYGFPFLFGYLENRFKDMNMVEILLFPDEESVKEFNSVFTEEPFTWEYVEYEESVPPETYLLHLIDQYGDPVPGVRVSFCTDTQCTALISDENGLITFSGEPEDYHIQLLKTPEGFSFDPDFELRTGSTFGEWNLLIRRD